MVLNESLYWGILPKNLGINRRLGKNFGGERSLKDWPSPSYEYLELWWRAGAPTSRVTVQVIVWSGKFVGAAKRENH